MILNALVLRVRLYFILTIFLAIIFMGSSSWAAGSTSRIGFVVMEKAVAGTKEWKKEFAEFKVEFQQEKTKIAVKEKQVKQMFEELKKQSSVLAPSFKQKKEERFRNEKKDFERYVQDKNEEFGRREKAITDKMIKKMIKVIQRIGKEKKMAMILDQKMAIYSSPENDLTDVAIRMYDRVYGRK